MYRVEDVRLTKTSVNLMDTFGFVPYSDVTEIQHY